MILRHRDRELLRFEWTGLEGVRVVSVNEAEKRFLPLEMRGEATDGRLWEWLRHRILPKHRQYVHYTLEKLGIDYNVRSIITVSKGLSLNDVHWVTDDKDKSTWAKVNLYDNPFSELLARMAFTGMGPEDYSRSKKIDLPKETSPEFTTNGMLAKCWRRIDGQIYLYKSGTEGAANTGFEPYSEFYAAQVAEALGLEHVPYGLEMFKKRLCSTCPLFTSEKVGFVSAARAVGGEAALADARFADTFFLDSIILNTDRHLGNFGYLVDNDTNTIIGPSPIFDNGYGLFALAMDRPGSPWHEFDDLRKYIKKTGPALYLKWAGFPGGITTRMQSLAMKLVDFHFTRHPFYNLSQARLQKVEDFVRKRASKIAEYAERADDFLLVDDKSGGLDKVESAESGGLNSDENALISSKESLSIQLKANLKADPYVTVDELSDILPVPKRTIERRLKELRDAGEVVHEGGRSGGYWRVLK